MSYKLKVELIGRVTPCTPMPVRSLSDAHGVTRPTLET